MSSIQNPVGIPPAWFTSYLSCASDDAIVQSIVSRLIARANELTVFFKEMETVDNLIRCAIVRAMVESASNFIISDNDAASTGEVTAKEQAKMLADAATDWGVIAADIAAIASRLADHQDKYGALLDMAGRLPTPLNTLSVTTGEWLRPQEANPLRDLLHSNDGLYLYSQNDQPTWPMVLQTLSEQMPQSAPAPRDNYQEKAFSSNKIGWNGVCRSFFELLNDLSVIQCKQGAYESGYWPSDAALAPLIRAATGERALISAGSVRQIKAKFIAELKQEQLDRENEAASLEQILGFIDSRPD